MNQYDPSIHHRRSLRLKGYDYADAGIYFITICCQNKAHLFGQIVKGKMILNEYGIIAANEWLNTSNIPQNIELGEFVIMPNHIHGIIKITRRDELHSSKGNIDDGHQTESHSSIGNIDDSHQTESHSSQIMPISINLQKKNEVEFHSHLRGTSNTIGAIVRGFKSSVTRQLNLLNIGCVVWRRNYYETIIRDQISF